MMSCELAKIDDYAGLSESAKNHADMSGEFNSVFEFVNSIGTEDPGLSGKSTFGILPACATATIDQSTRTLEVDFGDSGCLCKDGISRQGIIRAVFTGDYRTAGSTVEVTLTDYIVNDIPFTGTKTITNLGNQSGNFKYSYVVSNATAEFPFGTISWSTELTIERIEGDGTTTIWDDVYSVDGSSNGTSSYGTTYEVVTEVPLVKINETDCLRNFVSGILILNDSKGNEIKLDYDPIGGGQCDKTAELTINGGDPFIITLR